MENNACDVMAEKCAITYMPHHMQQKLCQTRSPYRQGKKLTAVKVYTINDESQHLLICGVPKLQLEEEIKKLIYTYGDVKAIQLVTEYPSEKFTETFHVHYTHIQSARLAKRINDNKNFFGGLLHVFYAPELETLPETKMKLMQRCKDVAMRIRKNQQDLTNPEVDKFVPREQFHRRKKNPALPLTKERLEHCYPGKTSSVFNGSPQNIDPLLVFEPNLPLVSNNSNNSTLSVSLSAPYQPTESILQTGVQRLTRNSESNMCKEKNYKGHCISDNAKIKIVQPRRIDIKNITKLTKKKNVFCNVKKMESSITIKLLKKSNNEKKKIVIKNPNVTRLIQPTEDLQDSIQAAKLQIRTAMQKILD